MASVQIPEKFAFLFESYRYKGAYGGRGSAKSWSFATALIAYAAQGKERIVCCRELQKSIKESSHHLIASRINELDLTDQFDIYDKTIINRVTESDFIFEGLFRNVHAIKSMEGATKAWVEEAQKVSEESWKILIPTLRHEGPPPSWATEGWPAIIPSEIWISWNPEFEDDATHKRFAVDSQPNDSKIVEVNYYDNPFFPNVLRKEMEQDKARDFASYEYVWLGKPKGSGRRVWSAYDEEVHLREVPIEFIAKHGICYTSMDPHSKYYPFVVCIALLPKNARKKWPEDWYKHVYAEYPTHEHLGGFYHDLRKTLLFPGTLADLSREVQLAEGASFGIKPRARVMDTRFAKGAGGDNWSTSTEGMVKLLAKPENGGLIWGLPKEKTIDVQREVIHKDMLWSKNLPRGEFNEPTFSVDPSCKNLRASLKNHRLEEDKEKESEKYKDPSDALRIGWAAIQEKGIRPRAAESTGQVLTVDIGGGYWGNG